MRLVGGVSGRAALRFSLPFSNNLRRFIAVQHARLYKKKVNIDLRNSTCWCSIACPLAAPASNRIVRSCPCSRLRHESISHQQCFPGVLPLNQLALQPTLTIPHQRRNGPPFHPTLCEREQQMGDYLFGRSLTHRRRGHIDFALNRRCREYRPCGSAVLHTILLPCAPEFDISSCGCAAALPVDFHANSFQKVQGTNQGTNVPSRSSPGLVSHARTRARGGVPRTNR